jgi:Mor family transcriptional regulator
MELAINLLPESVVEIISLIGEQETHLLIKCFAGRAVFFSMNAKKPCAISPSSWVVLCKRFGGNQVFIPRCHKALLHGRNQQIKADRRNGLALAELTEKYTLTSRQIFTIIKCA